MKVKEGIPKVVLGILGGARLLTVALVAPNVIQLLDLRGKRRTFPKQQFRNAINRLEKRGYIRLAGERNAWHYELTKEGRLLLERRRIEDLKIQKPLAWDGKWRMVMFDIPENLRKARNALRDKLRHLGFHSLNLSVWVYPHECKDEINAVVAYYDVGKYVRYARTDYFDGMERVCARFGLLQKS